jgi:multidrug efflux pump subunit AcrB
VLMTAAAMLIGMLPMSLGLGEGGEQNAPLGRAVIGGLFMATIATLLFVPVVFSFMHRKAVVRTKADDSSAAAALANPNPIS